MMLRVQQLMTQNVQVCGPDDTLDCVARLLWENDIGAVPVNGSTGSVIAMVTDRDVCMAAYTTGRPLSQICVHEAMSKTLATVRADRPIDDAQRIMRDCQVRRLPVLDERGSLVGVISQNDLLREAARQREAPRKELSAVAVTATVATIGRSRSGQLVAA
jgi:predicted transcriptional regulator